MSYVHKIRRERIFYKFDKKYISNMFKISFDSLQSMDWNSFKYAVTGSDQVWHGWTQNQNELKYFYLNFINKEKRIAYAASFGFNAFPDKDLECHKEGISAISALSCREIQGQRLIKMLTGRDVPLLADPTLLPEIRFWENLERKPTYVAAEKYILVYFLGEKTSEYILEMQRLAEKGKLEIVDVHDENNLRYFFTSPDEFLWFVHNAEYICTDSFHACVFSILYHKKFMVFQRREIGMEHMFGRMESLFQMLGIENRIFFDNIDVIENDIPYDCVDKKKKQIVDESLWFLKKSLN